MFLCAGAFQAGRGSSSSASGVHHGLQLENEDAAHTLLSISPEFAHDLQPGELDTLLASGYKLRVYNKTDLERMSSELNLQEVDLAQSETEPGQGQACGQAGSQQDKKASGQNADSPKPAGNNKKKKKNKRQAPKAAQVEQVTARGIMEGPPAPKGLPSAHDPLPCPGHEPTDDDPIPDAPSAAACSADPDDSLYSTEHHSQAEPGADVPAENEPHGPTQSPEEPELAQGVPIIEPEVFSGPGFSTEDLEQFTRLHISVPTESEEELFHDASSGFESAAQLTSLGSRHASLDSDMAWPLYSSAGKFTHATSMLDCTEQVTSAQ